TECSTQQIGRARHQLIDIKSLGRQGLTTGESQQLAGKVSTPQAGLKGRLDPSTGYRMLLHLRVKQLEVTNDDRQHIVKIMRHTACELADSLHPLGMSKLPFGLLSTRKVVQDDEYRAIAVVDKGHSRDFHLDFLPV